MPDPIPHPSHKSSKFTPNSGRGGAVASGGQSVGGRPFRHTFGLTVESPFGSRSTRSSRRADLYFAGEFDSALGALREAAGLDLVAPSEVGRP